MYLHRFLHPTVGKRGYMMVYLRKNKIKHRKYVHRLVAETFIENPMNHPEIDHIDTNRLNNTVSNLRWVTRQENCNNPITRMHSKENSLKAERHPFFGKVYTPHERELYSKRQIGHRLSEESKNKISQKNKGHKATKRAVVQLSLNGEYLCEYKSLSDAARSVNTTTQNIYGVVSGRKHTTSGYKWIYKEQYESSRIYN